MNLITWGPRGIAAAIVLLVASGAAVSADTCDNSHGTSSDDVVAACTRLISSGRASGETLARYYNNRGVAFANKHNYDRAVEDYSQAVKINPRNITAFHNRGLSYHQKGDDKHAVEDYTRAIGLDSKLTKAYLDRARAYRVLRDYDKAIQDADAVIRLDSKLAAAYLLRGSIYGQKGDYDHAIPDLDRAVALDPSASSLGGRGYVYLQKNDLDRAFADYTRAISLNPNYALWHNQRGVVLERKGLVETALADYDDAIRLEATNPITFKNRGVARRRKGDVQGAVADYDQALKLDPQYNAAYTERGRAYEALNNPAAARASYEAAVSLPPKYDTGQGAIDAARARLAALNGVVGIAPPAPSPAPAAAPSSKPAAAPPSQPAAAPPPQPAGAPPSQPAPAPSSRLATAPPAGPAAAPPSRPAAAPPPAPAVVSTAPQSSPPLPAPQTGSARKLALVLGNSAYQRQALRNPDNDARAMAKALRQIGFDVIDGYNLDYTGMRRVISEFAVKASTAQLALVFYAGHGLSIAGHNYLVPVDAKMESAVAANFELFDLDQIIASVDDPARTTVIILDACRNNPFATQASTRAMNRGGGLAGYDSVAAGMLIAFATRPGQVAKDGSGDHSPFTAALLKYIATPNLEILDMLRRVRREVLQETNGEQITWDNESLFGDVFLVDGGRREVAK
jgi:tetratricopeptide (TPR) repeat protein